MTNMNLTDLPVEMIDKILSYLSYDQIAKLRAVNRLFNIICSDKLNKGFILVNQFHIRCLKAVKTKLPRRESERRHHPLARHNDILMAVETRLSMLSMTFSKYVEAQQCCFIPGKVLDEALKVLRIVNNCLTPESSGQFPLLPRPHDFLQEYRDVSSMAMEHFDDKILPGIKLNMRIPSSPRLYCFKTASKSDARKIIEFHRHRPTKSEEASTLMASEASGIATNCLGGKCPGNKPETGPLSKLSKAFRGIQSNKIKYKVMHRSVEALHQSFRQMARQMKRENLALRNQMMQQRAMIKHLRRELRETRAAMNVMSKDLNQIKVEHSPTRGTKRKREDCDENCV